MNESIQLEKWAGAPRTTLALVITDIVGSTALNNKLWNREWYAAYGEHRGRVDELISKYDCQKVKDTGDGF